MDKITDGKEMAKVLSLFANSFNPDIKGFVEGIMSEHRTLQQTMCSMMIATIKGWAECYEKGRYDLRNEQTCKIAKLIWDDIKNDTYLPLI